ncbi:MAG: sulfatase [Verrucomicrobiaceae bacterium]
MRRFIFLVSSFISASLSSLLRGGTCFAVLAVSLCPALHSSFSAQPNVVLFLVDDMGWTDCGVYGSQYYETPNIDRFAKKAMRFTNAYSQPLCSPTRGSILTGQYSARHKITTASGHQPPQPEGHVFLKDSAPPNVAMLTPESKNYLEPSQITLAETLKGAGYRTAHIGKWHLGLTQPYWPEQQGFDVAFHCHPDPGPPGEYFSPYGVVPDGMPTNKQRVGTITDGPEGEYIVDRQAEEAVKFIQGSKGGPFFLNLWCYGVHGPWGHKVEFTKHFATKKDPSGRQGNPIMGSMLKSVDECFGRILDELDKQGVADNTIIIFYSDNGGNTHSNVPGTGKTAAAEKNKGEFLADWRKWAGDQPPTMNTPLRDGKGTLYEGGTRVPLMWSWAGKIAPGTTSDAIVGCIDVYPTVIDLLGIAKPERQVFDGVSYAKVLKNEGGLKRTAYFNYHPHAGTHRAGGVWVRSGDWKLLRWFGNPDAHELYNLKDDLSEANDLAAKMPDKVKELDALIDGFLKDTGATYPRPNPAYKPVAAKTPAAKTDPLDNWKERGCKAAVAEGILTMKSTGRPSAAFLGHGMAKMNGPAVVKLRVRSASGGAGKIDSLPNTSADPSVVHSAALEVKAGDWQELTVEIKDAGPLGTMRVYLPDSEIDFIEVAPTGGKTQRWDF